MHELSVCVALVAEVERIARERGATEVTRIQLQIGPLSGIETPLLERAWPLAAAGSVAADAELRIGSTGIRVRCTTCGEESDATPNRLLCGACGDFRTRIVSGDELLLERLELTTADAGAATQATVL